MWLALTWFALLVVGMIQARRVLRTRAGPVAIAGAAAFGSLWIFNVAQTFDPHMTLRGSADAFYPLLALMMVASPAVFGSNAASDAPLSDAPLSMEDALEGDRT